MSRITRHSTCPSRVALPDLALLDQGAPQAARGAARGVRPGGRSPRSRPTVALDPIARAHRH
jgi:hypothetical protein